MEKNKLLVFAVAVIILVLALFYLSRGSTPNADQVIGGQKDANGCLVAAGYSWCEAKKTCIRQWEEYCTAAPSKTVTFECRESKSIIATFYPMDDKFVDVKLSDGKNIKLPRALSASGARYATSDEALVFWNKGDTAFVTEGGNETYSNCVLK